ncbi:MAG: YceD family protein [Polaromonas sp.]|nr:YceD family protein [Polaromonas sp.]
MTRSLQATRLNLQTLAQEGVPFIASTLLKNLERLAQEAQDLPPDAVVNWQATAELRPCAGADDQLWLHLQAKVAFPMTCQRCMGVVLTPLEVDQWYRFVASEEIAMAEDDASEEDLLVMAPQFDLLAVLEDELLMALPLVPMHDECPEAAVLQAGEDDLADQVPEKPNPFALLAQLKKEK